MTNLVSIFFSLRGYSDVQASHSQGFTDTPITPVHNGSRSGAVVESKGEGKLNERPRSAA